MMVKVVQRETDQRKKLFNENMSSRKKINLIIVAMGQSHLWGV